MNIFHKIAWKGLLKSRTRTLVTVVGVALSAALLTGVATFGISLLDYMAKGAAMRYGDWHAGVFGVPEEVVQQCVYDSAVDAAAAVENIGYALLEGKPENAKPYFFVAGYTDEAFRMLPVQLIGGRLPENGSEAVISGTAQRDGVPLGVGDTLTLEVGDRSGTGGALGQYDLFAAGEEQFTPRETRTFTIVGICQTPSYEGKNAPGYDLITAAGGGAGSYSLFVKLVNPRTVYRYMEGLADGRHAVANDNVLRFMGISQDKLFVTLLYVVGGIVAAIIMVGSVFLIHNSFQISLNERTHQLGILMSVGATQRQLRGSVLFEGLCIGAAGIPLGMLLGFPCIRAVIALTEKNFYDVMYEGVPLRVVLSAPLLAAAAVVSLVTILVSAYIPAKKAAGTPVMECIRQTNEVKLEAKEVKTSRLVERVCGLEGMLALKNFKRNRRRYRSVVLSLALSVVLFVSTNSFVGYLSQASEMAVVFTNYNVALSLPDMQDEGLLALYGKLRAVDGVTGGDCQKVLGYTCTVDADACTQALRSALGAAPGQQVTLSLKMQFLDDSTYLEMLEEAGLPAEEYTGEGGKLIALAKLEDHRQKVLNPDEFVDMFLEPEQEFALVPQVGGGAGEPQPVTLTALNIVPKDVPPGIGGEEEQLPYFWQVTAPWSRKAEFEVEGAVVCMQGLVFNAEAPAQAVKEMREILSREDVQGRSLLVDMDAVTKENTNMIFIAKVFSYTFIVMVSLIAVANVFNTISTNIKLRRRELAMLRSTGMSERSFQRMMNFECVFYGLQALLAGLPASFVLSCLIYKGMYAGGAEEITFMMPWASAGASVAGVLLVVFITMLYAVRKLKKENIIDALRDELM